jgi:cell pole-organizing protein PopZ
MEEILASIRRIISEDDAPPADGEEASPAAEEPVAVAIEAAPEPEPEPEPLALEPEPVAAVEPEPAPPVEEEEALELTEKVETHGDLDVFPTTAPEPVAAPELRPAVENLVGERAATAAASSFGALSAAILMPKGDRTLEDVVRDLLRPMLQQWLDDNLPTIVQQAVETEVDRIARGRVR